MPSRRSSCTGRDVAPGWRLGAWLAAIPSEVEASTQSPWRADDPRLDNQLDNRTLRQRLWLGAGRLLQLHPLLWLVDSPPHAGDDGHRLPAHPGRHPLDDALAAA